MLVYETVVIDKNKSLDPKLFEDSASDELSFFIAEDEKTVLSRDYSSKIGIIAYQIKDPSEDLKTLNSMIKELSSQKVIILIFANRDEFDFDLIDYINEKRIDKLVLSDFDEAHISEEAINATVIFADKFGDGSDLISNEAALLKEVNAELELRNQWMEQELTLANVFGDVSLTLDQKLSQCFSLIVDNFSIEHFAYYSAFEKDDNLKLVYKFSSSESVKDHKFSEVCEYPPVFVYYNRESLLINDYSVEDRVGKNPNMDFNINASIAIPVNANNKIIGVVEFYNKNDSLGDQFPQPVFRFLSNMVHQLHYLIEISLLKDQIQRSRNEMRDILNTVRQGILTLSHDSTIKPEYSKAVESIFSSDEIAGKNLAVLLYEGHAEEELKTKDFIEWVKTVYDMPDSWDLLKGLQIKNLQTEITNEEGVRETKYLEIDYERIMKAGALESLMVIITDVTAQKLAEEKLKKVEEDRNIKISMLMQIIKLKPNIFHDFLKVSVEKLNGVKKIISEFSEYTEDEKNEFAYKEILNDLFAEIHAIKGSTSFLGLVAVASQFHKIEEMIKEIQKNKDYERLTELFSDIEENSQFFFDLINTLLGLISEFAEFSVSENIDQLERNNKILKLLKPVAEVFKDRNSTLYNEIVNDAKAGVSAFRKSKIEKLERKCLEMVSRQGSKTGKDIKFSSYFDPEAPLEQLSKLDDVLIPILINAVDHGIETKEERETKKKPPKGKIDLSTSYDEDGKIVQVMIKDDGKGLDLEKIKQMALKKKIKTKEEISTMSEEELRKLIFLPTLSTSSVVTHTSGRGYGMDIVRRAMSDMNGEIYVDSSLGEKTEITLVIPVD